MATKLLITAEHSFCFSSLSVAMAFVTAPFDIALTPAFIDFDFIGDKCWAKEIDTQKATKESTPGLH